jgi:hypothetical protein
VPHLDSPVPGEQLGFVFGPRRLDSASVEGIMRGSYGASYRAAERNLRVRARKVFSATLPIDFEIGYFRYHLGGILRYGGFRRIHAHSCEFATGTASLLGIRIVMVLALKGL